MIQTASISKQSVHAAHQQQLLNGYNNDHQMSQIVEIIGGIDVILSDYLNSINRLTETDILKISDIITTPKTHLQNDNKNSVDTEDSITGHDTGLVGDIYYEFHKNGDFLHSIFPSQMANKTRALLHSTKFQIALVLGSTAAVIPTFFPVGRLVWRLSPIFAQILLMIPYAIFWILSANKVACRSLIRSFELWFKICYAMAFGCLLTVYFYHFDSINNVERYIQILGCINNILLTFTVVLMTISLSVFDAICIGRKWTIIASALLGIACLCGSFLWEIGYSDDQDYVVHFSVTKSNLSFYSMMASTLRILAIFSAKQSLMAYIKKDKAVVIKYSPVIKWKDDTETETEMVEMVTVKSQTGEYVIEEIQHKDVDTATSHKMSREISVSISTT